MNDIISRYKRIIAIVAIFASVTCCIWFASFSTHLIEEILGDRSSESSIHTEVRLVKKSNLTYIGKCIIEAEDDVPINDDMYKVRYKSSIENTLNLLLLGFLFLIITNALRHLVQYYRYGIVDDDTTVLWRRIVRYIHVKHGKKEAVILY
ncbi:hypothetical protein SAMN04487761_11324 [Lachnospiraceae bacterium C7]|nr:hypothetical protein SAMN04487761_11324 [Lachnospiraceae bacterium C7]